MRLSCQILSWGIYSKKESQADGNSPQEIAAVHCCRWIPVAERSKQVINVGVPFISQVTRVRIFWYLREFCNLNTAYCLLWQLHKICIIKKIHLNWSKILSLRCPERWWECPSLEISKFHLDTDPGTSSHDIPFLFQHGKIKSSSTERDSLSVWQKNFHSKYLKRHFELCKVQTKAGCD